MKIIQTGKFTPGVVQRSLSMVMLEGKLEITGGDGNKVTLEPGEAIFFPMGSEHQIVSVAKKSKFVIIYSPPRPVGK